MKLEQKILSEIDLRKDINTLEDLAIYKAKLQHLPPAEQRQRYRDACQILGCKMKAAEPDGKSEAEQQAEAVLQAHFKEGDRRRAEQTKSTWSSNPFSGFASVAEYYKSIGVEPGEVQK